MASYRLIQEPSRYSYYRELSGRSQKLDQRNYVGQFAMNMVNLTIKGKDCLIQHYQENRKRRSSRVRFWYGTSRMRTFLTLIRNSLKLYQYSTNSSYFIQIEFIGLMDNQYEQCNYPTNSIIQVVWIAPLFFLIGEATSRVTHW